jgi:AraC-like DNA-binding protein
MEFPYHGVGSYHQGTPVGPARWPHHDIIFSMKGSFHLEFDKRSMELTEGNAVLIPPGNRFHGATESETAVMWVLHFRGYKPPRKSSIFNRARRPVHIANACVTPFDRELLHEFSRTWKGVKNKPRQLAISLLGKLIFCRLEYSLSRQADSSPPYLRVITDQVLAGNFHLNITQMARLADISVSHFRSQFRKHYRLSPLEFLQQSRVKEAARLLSETCLPIKEIGQRVGYGDLVAFHRAFRRETGTTPAVYRRRYYGIV